jgi:hypothetical protein
VPEPFTTIAWIVCGFHSVNIGSWIIVMSVKGLSNDNTSEQLSTHGQLM